MKQVIIGGLVSLGLVGMLVGCGEAKTQEYYSKNIEEAKAKAKECKENESKFIGEQQKLLSGGTPSKEFQECVNATDAVFSNKNNRKNIYEKTNPDAYKW